MGDTFFGGINENAKQVGTADLMTPEQRDVLDKLGRTVSQQIGKGVTPYPGEITAGSNPLLEQLFGLAGKVGSGTAPLQAETTGALSDILGEFDTQGVSDFFEKGIKAPAMAMFEEDILPQVLEPFAGMDALDSGGARRAAASAGRRLATDVSGQLADVLFRSKEGFEGRKLLGAEMGASYPGTLASILSSVGGTKRTIEQEQLSGKLEEFLRTQAEANPWLKNFLSQILGASAFQPIVQGPEMRAGMINPLAQAGGQIGAAYLGRKQSSPSAAGDLSDPTLVSHGFA